MPPAPARSLRGRTLRGVILAIVVVIITGLQNNPGAVLPVKALVSMAALMASDLSAAQPDEVARYMRAEADEVDASDTPMCVVGPDHAPSYLNKRGLKDGDMSSCSVSD